ncbi:methyltransferase domain-containing protein [bacterium]|nr:methyltransferase domain-containing protein [bacterium]
MTDTKVFFDQVASRWNLNYKKSRLFQQRLNKIQELSNDVSIKDKAILDLGCGSGMISFYFAQSDARVTGIDVSEDMIGEARLLFSQNNMNATFAVGDATALNFPDATFDLITCISVLEWIENDEKALREISRVLKKDGILILSVPNKSSLLRWFEKLSAIMRKSLLRLSKTIKPSYLEYQHHQYRSTEIQLQLQKFGLSTLTSLYYAGPFENSKFIQSWMSHSCLGMMYFLKCKKTG